MHDQESRSSQLADQSLKGKVVAVPESRQLDVFAGLLERRGATVLRCPLVAIKDAPDPAPVLHWISQFNAGSCDDLILLTGEGLRRLLSCIDRHTPEWRADFVAQLARVRTVTRGPKPAKALRELGLAPSISALEPTTQGVIASLSTLDLHGRNVGVQLYGAVPNPDLMDFLQRAGARAVPVAPYVYADAIDDAAVLSLVRRMANDEVDIIAFTSMAQVKRLFAVCPLDLLHAAFAHVQVAAVGPVVRDELLKQQVQVNCMPDDSFFMKPLVTAISEMADAGH